MAIGAGVLTCLPGQISHSLYHLIFIHKKVPSDDMREIETQIVNVVIFM